MVAIFTTPEEIDTVVLRHMETLFRYPGTNEEGQSSAKQIYQKELMIFDLVDLKKGWRRVIQTHKSPWWPSIATLLSACRGELLHRSLKELGRPLPSPNRRAWASFKREVYLKAASNGFSRTATDQALSTARDWIRTAMQN